MASIANFSLTTADDLNLPVVRVSIRPRSSSPCSKVCQSLSGLRTSRDSNCSSSSRHESQRTSNNGYSARFVVHQGASPVAPKARASSGAGRLHFSLSPNGSEPGTRPELLCGAFPRTHSSGTDPGVAPSHGGSGGGSSSCLTQFLLAPEGSGFVSKGLADGRLCSFSQAGTVKAVASSSGGSNSSRADSLLAAGATIQAAEQSSLLAVSSLSEALSLAPVAGDAAAGAMMATRMSGIAVLSRRSGAGQDVAVPAQGMRARYKKALADAVQQQIEWKGAK